MALKLVRSVVFSALAMGGLSSLLAQSGSGSLPMLRLVSATVGPLSIVPGSNGINQTVEAYNAGAGVIRFHSLVDSGRSGNDRERSNGGAHQAQHGQRIRS